MVSGLFIMLEDEFKLISNFEDLPESEPYGFWLSPQGDLVLTRKHLSAVASIISRVCRDSPQVRNISYDSLYHRGWYRIVMRAGAPDVALHADNKHKEPTLKQRAGIRDLASWYRIERICINGKSELP